MFVRLTIYSDSDEEKFFVEEILHRRMCDGKVQYFLKWKGFPSEDNTWESAEDLDYTDLIAAFEKQMKNKTAEAEDSHEKRKFVTASAFKLPVAIKKEPPDEEKSAGFDRGLQPEKILGATDKMATNVFDEMNGFE